MDRLRRAWNSKILQNEGGVFKKREQPQIENNSRNKEGLFKGGRFTFIDQGTEDLVDDYRNQQHQDVVAFPPSVENEAGNQKEKIGCCFSC